jgi:hypothetical protein
VKFGNVAFNDYVVVEGSEDGGVTWRRFSDGYDIVGQSTWVNAFNNNTPGASAMFKTRTIDMTSSGHFEAGDEVIIRFRMFSDGVNNGWGWAIDNLHIQDAVITSAEKESAMALSIYPNPAKEKIIVEAKGLTVSYCNIQLMNLQGQIVYSSVAQTENGKLLHSIPASALNSGLYLVKISNEGKAVTQKIVKD